MAKIKIKNFVPEILFALVFTAFAIVGIYAFLLYEDKSQSDRIATQISLENQRSQRRRQDQTEYIAKLDQWEDTMFFYERKFIKAKTQKQKDALMPQYVAALDSADMCFYTAHPDFTLDQRTNWRHKRHEELQKREALAKNNH